MIAGREPPTYNFRDVASRLRQINARLIDLITAMQTAYSMMEKYMAKLEDVEREVGEMSSVIDGAITLINSLANEVRNAKDDPARLEKLANDLDQKAGLLAAAVAANTIAKPELEGGTTTEPTPQPSPTDSPPAPTPPEG